MLLVLPLLIPLFAAAVSLLCWSNLRLQRGLAILAMSGLLAASAALMMTVRQHGIQAVQIGAWPAPFGITLVADHLSALMVLIGGVIGFCVTIYSLADIDAPRQQFGYFPLLHMLLLGVTGAFLTGDLFNLYVWFEVLLISSFVLMALGGERAQLEGALKYVTLNLVSSFLFLIAVGVLYGAVGTLNMAHIALQLGRLDPELETILAMLFLVTFGIKAAVFPLFFWLPPSYHTPPAAVATVFAALLSKVGVYALIRVFTLLFIHDVRFTHTLILVISGLTMVTGVLGAVAQSTFRRIISFHIISQIGYMTFGLGLFTVQGLAGAVFFIAHQIAAKANLFLVSGIVQALFGTDELKKVGGLYRSTPGLALLFGISALSLAGIPPLSGFVGKLALVRAGLEARQYAITGTAVGVSLLTLFSMLKIWNSVFWPPDPGANQGAAIAERRLAPWERVCRFSPVVLLALLSILMGVWAAPLLATAEAAAHELLNPSAPGGYIDRVLGSDRP